MKTRRLTTQAKRKTIAGLQRKKPAPPARGEVARVVSIEASGLVLAELASRPGHAIPVRLGLPLDRPALAALIERRQPVLLMPAAGDEAPWLVAVEHVAGDGAATAPARAASAVQATALVDGKRVELRGEDEIVISCGEASITLRRNGRVVVRGTYVESHSKGTNRIKGGSVQIN